MPATLTARPRSERGKNAARALRRSGRIPAVSYGHGEETRSLTVDALELEKLLASISVENTLIELQVEGGDTSRALIREVQQHPFKLVVLHVDFYQVHAGERLTLQIPIRLVGTPVGVEDQGGVLDQVIYELDIECLPVNIPAVAELDVSGLDIGDSLRIHDIRLPDVEILNDEDLTVCSVTAPTVVEEPEEPETELGIGEIEEPELIGDRAEDAEDVDVTEQG